MEELFIKASRLKLKFKTVTGNVSVEDLWDLPLESDRLTVATLDDVAIALNKELEASKTGGSFVKLRNVVNKEVELRFEIVKYIISVKLEEAATRKLAADKRALKQKIMGLMEEKKDQALSAKSLEELQAELDKLD